MKEEEGIEKKICVQLLFMRKDNKMNTGTDTLHIITTECINISNI